MNSWAGYNKLLIKENLGESLLVKVLWGVGEDRKALGREGGGGSY